MGWKWQSCAYTYISLEQRGIPEFLFFFNDERTREIWYQLPVIGTGRKKVNNHRVSWVKYKIHTGLKECPKMPEVSCFCCNNQLHNLSARKSKFSSSNERMHMCETKHLWKWLQAPGIYLFLWVFYMSLSFYMGCITWIFYFYNAERRISCTAIHKCHKFKWLFL